MKDKDIIGSSTDKEMDKFWEEYRSKLNPILKQRIDEDEDEGPLQFVITSITGYFTNGEPKKPSKWQRIKPLIATVIRMLCFVGCIAGIWYVLIRIIIAIVTHK